MGAQSDPRRSALSRLIRPFVAFSLVGSNMVKRARHIQLLRQIELLRQIDNDLLVQYDELTRLRAKLARLLFPLKGSAPRKYRIARGRRSAARAVTRHDRHPPRPAA